MGACKKIEDLLIDVPEAMTFRSTLLPPAPRLPESGELPVTRAIPSVPAVPVVDAWGHPFFMEMDWTEDTRAEPSTAPSADPGAWSEEAPTLPSPVWRVVE